VKIAILALAACSGGAPAIGVDAMTAADGDLGDSALPDAPAGRARCDEPLASVGDPTAVHGVFAIEFPQKVQHPVPSVVLDNPAVCGGNIYVVWKTVDAGPNAATRYDFSSVDSQIAEWIGAGKSVNLVVWAVSDGSTNTATPQYVLDQVTTVSCANEANVPVFFKEPYPTLYKAFIAQVLARYGSNPAVGYIRFGLSAGGETFPICESELKTNGFTTPIWESYVSDLVTYQAGLHAGKQLMLGINSYGTPPDNSVPDYEAGLAIANHFGIGSQGLQTSDIASYQAGKACTVDWCKNFDTYVGQGPLELQMDHNSVPDGSGTGSVATLVPFAVQRHAQILELFEPDLEAAYDPDNAGYATYGAGYRAAIEAAVAVVGGR
jgi:hypothetical protein